MKNPIAFEPGDIVVDDFTGDVWRVLRHRKDGVTEMQHEGLVDNRRTEWNSHNNPRFSKR